MMNLQIMSVAKRGFSFLEVMAVVGLVGIIVAITITRIADSTDNAKAKSCAHNRTQLNSTLEQFAISTGDFATSMADINTDDYFPGGIPVCPVSGAPYTLNTTTHRIEGHTNSSDH